MDLVGLAAFVQEENENWEICIHWNYFSVKWTEVAIRPATVTSIQWEHNNGVSFKTNEQIENKGFLVKLNRNFQKSKHYNLRHHKYD